MPSPIYATPGAEKVRAIADQAANEPQGLEVLFTLAKHGTVENAARACRSFQVYFSSMRTKSRQREQRARMESTQVRDTYIAGKYDDLACHKFDLPNGEGFGLHLVKGSALDIFTDVRSRETGEPIVPLSADFAKAGSIIILWFRALDKRNATGVWADPLTWEDKLWIWKHDPAMAKEAGISQAQETLTMRPFDPANVSLDDMFGPMEGEEGAEE